MKGISIEERAVELAHYIINTKDTVRGAAVKFGVSKSTVHKDVTLKNGKRNGRVIPESIEIKGVFLSESLKKIEGKLLIRDYYSNATYYRILIPNLYPQYEKVLYLDSDIIILDDIAKLYNVNINNYLIGAVSERWFRNYTEFKGYGEKVIGLKSYKKYINAGIMLMNSQN